MLRTILLLGLVFLVLWGVLYVAQAPRLTDDSLVKENISPVPDSAALSKLRYLEEPISINKRFGWLINLRVTN